MIYQKTIDEYTFEGNGFTTFRAYIELQHFRIQDGKFRFGFEFTEATSITDEDITDSDVDKVCGRVIDYPWGFENKGLHVFRGSRLEKVVREHYGSQGATNSSVPGSSATRV